MVKMVKMVMVLVLVYLTHKVDDDKVEDDVAEDKVGVCTLDGDLKVVSGVDLDPEADKEDGGSDRGKEPSQERVERERPHNHAVNKLDHSLCVCVCVCVCMYVYVYVYVCVV